MGTNYYAVPSRPSLDGPIHIGASHGDQPFLFHDMDAPYRRIPVVWHSYEEVINWLYENTIKFPFYVIMNEYEDIIPLNQFITIVERGQKYYIDNPNYYIYRRNVNGYLFYDGDFC